MQIRLDIKYQNEENIDPPLRRPLTSHMNKVILTAELMLTGLFFSPCTILSKLKDCCVRKSTQREMSGHVSV